LVVAKEGCPVATVGGTIYYVISIQNPTEYYATQIILADDVSENLENVEYSIGPDMQIWNEWTGTLSMDPIEPGGSVVVYLRGIVNSEASDKIINTAEVSVVFCEEIEEG